MSKESDVNKETDAPKEIDVNKEIQKIMQKISEYKDSIPSQFKNLEIDVKNWEFTVGKKENEYNLDIKLNLAIKAKKQK